MAIIKKTELKQLNKQAAEEKLNDLRKELMKANSQIAMGTMPENPGRIREMKRTITIVVGILFLVGWSSSIMATDHMSQDDHGKMGGAGMKNIAGTTHDDHKTMAGSGMEKMTGMANDDDKAMGQHNEGAMPAMTQGDTFTHQAVSQGIRADVKIMSLSSMNMTDPKGATHHIMIEFREDTTGAQIKEVVGKIKVIAPDKTEQSGHLKDFNGIYAVNLTFKEPGNYGVICLVHMGENKHLYKFWYPHN